tara:strand:- start:595 stop:1140 length:546 start_codon:yes stop_codon:yes gene_type:complete
MDKTTTTTINVATDPRLNIPKKAIDESYAASKQLEALTQTAADAVKQLVESKNTAEDFSKKLKKEDEERYKEEIKASKVIVKRIDSIVALYLGKEDDRQGITRNPEVTVMQRIGTANWYSGSRPNGLTATEKTLLRHAENQLDDALKVTNAFFVTEWPEYRSNMEKLTLSPFDEVKTFKTN